MGCSPSTDADLINVSDQQPLTDIECVFDIVDQSRIRCSGGEVVELRFLESRNGGGRLSVKKEAGTDAAIDQALTDLVTAYPSSPDANPLRFFCSGWRVDGVDVLLARCSFAADPNNLTSGRLDVGCFLVRKEAMAFEESAPAHFTRRCQWEAQRFKVGDDQWQSMPS